jgi:type IV pilus assembly protein PilX
VGKLNPNQLRPAGRASPRMVHGQRGVILVVSLVVLVAMMLAAAGLIRSVETSNVIAGNLSFQQATVNASDAGITAAITMVEARIAAGTQTADSGDGAYLATMQAGPPANWGAIPVAQTVDTDYEVKIVVDRLCTGATCITDPPEPGSMQIVGIPSKPPRTHYRATVRATGPRNTVSLTQTTLAR